MKGSVFMVSVCAFLAFSLRTDCYPSECTLPFPRRYVVYHLNEHEAIDVDGKLDDEAWDSVSWTEDFIGECLARGLGNGHVGGWWWCWGGGGGGGRR